MRQLHEFSVRHNLAVRYVDNAHVSSQLLLKRKSFGEAELILFLFLEKNRLSFGIEIGGKMILFRIINFDDLDSLPDLFRSEMSQVKDLNPLFTNISRVFVCGEKEIEEIAERLFDDMNIDYETLNPFKNIPALEKVKPEIINEKYSTFCAPAGIVFRPI